MTIIKKIENEYALTDADCMSLADMPANDLIPVANRLRNRGHGNVVTYSKKVFIPLTHHCRDVCHYCTFSKAPRRGQPVFLSRDEVERIARAGAAAGCTEALFTLGDKPELRYRRARAELDTLGHESTLSYLADAAAAALKVGNIFPHLNAGIMNDTELAALRPVSVSMGLMLEGIAPHLNQKGGPHHGSPDKDPATRLEAIAAAGRAKIPFTSGILIGIGESRRDRIAALVALRGLHERYGHIQEVIIQNFRAKAGTRMASAPEPSFADHLWTIAVARIIFGSAMNIQAPPNLATGPLADLIEAGINDWGGVSPITPDYVNPEAAWPHLEKLQEWTEAAGKRLVQRLPIYPSYLEDGSQWLAPEIRPLVLRGSDSFGFARADDWSPGSGKASPGRSAEDRAPAVASITTARQIAARAQRGEALSENEIVGLFASRGRDAAFVCRAADELREQANGAIVSYVVTRNINYTNVCSYRCTFCAFSKGKMHEHLRGRPYNLAIEEIERRCVEAWDRGATEVCMQGGIHPDFTGQTYIDICSAARRACPSLHIHAFSPLEVMQGARTLGVDLREFLTELKRVGLGSLPGTAAEILDDQVRQVICPDKLSTDDWLDVVRTAHRLGLRTTATIMFGHVERPVHWARHLLRIRELQSDTGGFTEFVPLPFVHMEAPMYLRGLARRGPTFRESMLMHAVARLVLNPGIKNIQVSWVKMGPDGVRAALQAGVNDLGGTLMNESISRAAGASFGEEMSPEAMEQLIVEAGRVPLQRTTLYAPAPAERHARSRNAPDLAPVVNQGLRRISSH